MENFKVSDIINATAGSLERGNPATIISNISTDSRTLKEGDLFVALKGENFDGHDFVCQAIEKGAVGVVVSHEIQGLGELIKKLSANPCIIFVKNTTIALGEIARCYREKFNIPIIGVTGSNGKTTTKDMTFAILSGKYNVLKSEGNLNNTIGLPLTLFRLSSQHQIAVFEMGISIPSEMSQLVRMAQPSLSVVTNVSSTHLEFLGSIEGVAREKQKLVEFSKDAVLNADDKLVADMSNVVKGDAIFYGIKSSADVIAKDIVIDQEGKPEFTALVKKPINAEERIKLPTIGQHNIYNALAGISVGVLFSVDMGIIKSSLESYQPIPMRMQKLIIDGVTIINDAYNSNPVSMKMAIDFLKDLKTDGRKILVVGDMLELGEQSNDLHKFIGKYIGEANSADMLITVGEKASIIAESAIKSGINRDAVFICKNNSEASDHLHKILKNGDTVLIKGSRGMKMEEIVKSLQNS
ncbi:MAG: UDP-N-acetylmuramoyl-tripeptide--D-alanyl-D-alanine ligase [Candidatus Poribacteria bacterium]